MGDKWGTMGENGGKMGKIQFLRHWSWVLLSPGKVASSGRARNSPSFGFFQSFDDLSWMEQARVHIT